MLKEERIEKILLNEDSRSIQLNSLILDNIKALKALSNDIAWQIFKELSKKESYPLEIAKKLGLQEQLAYYYFRKLFKAKLIEVSRTEERKGAIAKYFRTKVNAITLLPLDIKESKSNSIESLKVQQREMPEFLRHFIKGNELNTLIIVGSPEVHGSFNARAKDNFLAIDLALFLGLHASKMKMPVVKLDTYVSDLKELNANLIVIGGVLTNKISLQLNDFLSIKFQPKGAHWTIKSSLSGKEYEEETTGVIELLEHPEFKGKKILFLAGKTQKGTKSAILGLINYCNELSKGNHFNEKVIAHVVEGLDLDSDSIIDDVKILE